MDGTTTVFELINDYGAPAWKVLDDFGVELDDWDMRQPLDSLCDDYDLDLVELLAVLYDVCEDNDDFEDDDDQYDDDDDDDDDGDGDRIGSWMDESDQPLVADPSPTRRRPARVR